MWLNNVLTKVFNLNYEPVFSLTSQFNLSKFCFVLMTCLLANQVTSLRLEYAHENELFTAFNFLNVVMDGYGINVCTKIADVLHCIVISTVSFLISQPKLQYILYI